MSPAGGLLTMSVTTAMPPLDVVILISSVLCVIKKESAFASILPSEPPKASRGFQAGMHIPILWMGPRGTERDNDLSRVTQLTRAEQNGAGPLISEYLCTIALQSRAPS